MSWIGKEGGFAQVFGLRDNLYRDYCAFESVFSERQLLEPQLMALCKLRCHQLHRTTGCEHSLPADTVEALPQWYCSPLFSPSEKAALQLAECFCLDPHSISDEMAAAVVQEMGDAGLVALLEYLAICDGFARFQVILQTEVAA